MPQAHHPLSQGRDAGAARTDAGSIALVAAGGAIGTALRLTVAALLPQSGSLPIGVVIINLTGAFALGWLLEALKRSAPESRSRRAARLGVGTGVLGGYTTYSAFALGADGLLAMEDPIPGLLLSLSAVVGGVLAARCGSLIARRIHRKERRA